MPLFICNKCKCVENTALGQYWGQKKGNQLCSECATGKWHKGFPKEKYNSKKWKRIEIDSDFITRK